MIATIAVITAIIAIISKPLSSDRSDNDRRDRIFSISAVVVNAIATIAGKGYPQRIWHLSGHCRNLFQQSSNPYKKY